MRLYWIDVAEENWSQGPVGHGVGVTAYDGDEAVTLAKAAFAEFGMDASGIFETARIKQLDSLDELDPGHVRPNMGNHMKRGVWFPLLKSDTWNG